MTRKRKQPYTEIGIRRMTCARVGCDNQARYQWQICSDGNQWRPICAECDIGLNRVAMRFMFGKCRETDIAKYAAKVRAK